MIVISEKKTGNDIYFEKRTEYQKKDLIESIHFRAVQVSDSKETKYCMIYNPDMSIHEDGFNFLNFHSANLAENSRSQAMKALKLLFSFETIIGKQASEFTVDDVNNLRYFLHGYSPKGQLFQYELLTTRGNETVNKYLSIFRQYLSFLGIHDSPLQEKASYTLSLRTTDADINRKIAPFKSNEKIPRKIVEVPMYISVDEFARIVTYIRQHYSIREEIIVRLMFQCGLRIGEVLGLTAEDLKMVKIDNNYVPMAYIRNRVSDSVDQCAKTCMKIYNKLQYKSKDYSVEGFGYQYVVLPQDLFDLIDEYIEAEHVKARTSQKAQGRYYKKTIADSVEGEDENYYIFLNSLFTPLHSHAWNVVLRDIFSAVGIPLDSDKRKHNLNHRFRHGFAMFNVQYLDCKEVELAERMRHSSVNSVQKYYRPTISDQIKIKTDFANSLYDVIPELRREPE